MMMKIAACQMDSGADIAENLNKIRVLVSEASESGADVVCLPETVEYIGEDFRGNASDIPGEITDFFAAIAADNDIYLHCGSITERIPVWDLTDERDEGKPPRPRNTSLLFSPAGREIASYSKIHMFDVDVEGSDGKKAVCFRESNNILPGDSISVCHTALGVFGFAICYDLRFPELFRLQAMAGADVIFLPANFSDATGPLHWEPLLRARAIENGCYIVAADQVGTKPRFTGYGHSMIVDPMGCVVVAAGDPTDMEASDSTVGSSEIIYADVDTSMVTRARKELSSLSARRDDIYELSCDVIRHFYE